MSSPSIATAAGVTPRRRSRITRTDIVGWAFISPWLIGFVIFTAGPFLAALFLSLTNWDVAGAWEIVGLRNYQRMLSGDDDLFVLAVKNTLFYVVFNVPGIQIIALCVAALLNQQIRGIAIYRTLFYLPAVTAGIATAYLWANILSKFGLLNGMLGWIGIDGPNWLYSIEWSMPAIIIYSLWNVGTPMLVYLAALQGVPVHLHEAAMIDGAGVWTRFRHITVPMITPAVFFNMVLGIIGSFQVFTAAFIITAGGPANATLVYILYLYNSAFQQGKMGYASALAWFLFLVILAFTLVQLVMAKMWVYYEADAPGGRAGG